MAKKAVQQCLPGRSKPKLCMPPAKGKRQGADRARSALDAQSAPVARSKQTADYLMGLLFCFEEEAGKLLPRSAAQWMRASEATGFGAMFVRVVSAFRPVDNWLYTEDAAYNLALFARLPVPASRAMDQSGRAGRREWYKQ